MKLFSMCFIFFLSWSDRRSAHRDLQSDCSAGSLHDRWLHDVAQPFHHWNDLPFSCGQSVTVVCLYKMKALLKTQCFMTDILAGDCCCMPFPSLL